MPDFVVDEMSGPLIADVCRRLDGMPLAIELAAAQVRSLGLADQHGGSRGTCPSSPRGAPSLRPPSHASETVAWSCDLLNEQQRVVWRQLSVFAGGFTIEAAEEVVGGGRIAPAAIPEVLGDLVDQSMVVFEAVSDRYRLLEALREFAHEQLRQRW